MMFTRRLTEDERQQWERDGYCVLPGALTPQEVARLTRALDQLYQQHVVENPEADAAKGIDRRNVMEDDDVFVELMDHPGILGVVVDLPRPLHSTEHVRGRHPPAGPRLQGIHPYRRGASLAAHPAQ